MFDKKIVRGNTYAASVISKNKDKERTKKEQLMFKKPTMKAAQNVRMVAANHAVNQSTPRSMANRRNFESQTDEYVETLMDRAPERDCEIQTDFYIDKPPERLFTLRKYGVD
jgi:hypothetical protein